MKYLPENDTKDSSVTKDRTDHTSTKYDQMKYGGLELGLWARIRVSNKISSYIWHQCKQCSLL